MCTELLANKRYPNLYFVQRDDKKVFQIFNFFFRKIIE